MTSGNHGIKQPSDEITDDSQADEGCWSDQCSLDALLAMNHVVIVLTNPEPIWLGIAGELAIRLASGGVKLTIVDLTKATSEPGFYHGQDSAAQRAAIRLAETMPVRSPQSRLRSALRQERLASTEWRIPTISFRHSPIVPASGPGVRVEDFEYEGLPVGRAIGSTVSFWSGRDDIGQVIDAPRIRRMATSFVEVFDWAAEYLERLNPDAVLVFNGRFLHEWAIRLACERSGLPIYFFEMGATRRRFALYARSPHDNESLGSRIAESWAHAVLQNEIRARRIAHEWFDQRLVGKSASDNQFTRSMRRGMLPELPDDRWIVAFFLTSSHELTFTEGNEGFFGSQDFAVEQLIRLASRSRDVHLVVKMHPTTTEVNPRRSPESWHSPNVTILEKDSSVDSYLLTDRANVVLTFGSTIGVEAAYRGSTVVELRPSMYSDLDVTVRVSELCDTLTPGLESHPAVTLRERSLAFGYYCASNGIDLKYFDSDPNQMRLQERYLSWAGRFQPVARPLIRKLRAHF